MRNGQGRAVQLDVEPEYSQIDRWPTAHNDSSGTRSHAEGRMGWDGWGQPLWGSGDRGRPPLFYRQHQPRLALHSGAQATPQLLVLLNGNAVGLPLDEVHPRRTAQTCMFWRWIEPAHGHIERSEASPPQATPGRAAGGTPWAAAARTGSASQTRSHDDHCSKPRLVCGPETTCPDKTGFREAVAARSYMRVCVRACVRLLAAAVMLSFLASFTHLPVPD
ncbi:hypothetical protein AAL_03956 [Moelleriella libera RCEF 2490]|uniref:Uncharacterized protein n=1 Tax=Moelleriella libera RCEF 2490 TaxID=1081109 RepID=A0A168CKV9_9HYPO|nr:hypothetical protein AAL_03956 [Moelleriella libera RCEF 2490]